MNPRNTWRWLISAAVLFAAILIHHRFLRKTEPGPARILPALQATAVESIQVLRPAAMVEMQVQRTNGGWRLSKPISYPGRTSHIEALLAKLSGMIPVTSISAAELKNRPKADEEFGFANPQASILIQQGTKQMQLLIGGMTGPGDQFYLQVVGLDDVYVVNADILKLIPRKANDWRDTSLLDLKTLMFDHVAVTNSGKLYVEFQRDSTNAAWRMLLPLPLRADSAKIDQSLERLQSIRISQFVSDDPKADLETLGLQHADLELSLGQGTNVLAILQFGKTNNDGQIYARHLGQNTIVTVPKDLVAPWRVPVNDFRNQHLLSLTKAVQAIEVHGDDNFSLVRQNNDSWRVMPRNCPADTALVIDLLSLLSGMRIDFVQDLVTSSGLSDYGLAPPGRQFTLVSKPESGTATNTVLAELHFGARQTNRVLVRRSDESSVYAINTNDFDRLPSASWQLRERRLWNFTENDIVGATIRKQGKTTQMIRKDIYKWTIAPGSQGLIKNELALEESMRGLIQVSALAWVAPTEPNRARFGFKDGNLQISVIFKSGDKAAIEFGGEASPTSEYAAVTFAEQSVVLEFPWLLFRDLVTSLPVF